MDDDLSRFAGSLGPPSTAPAAPAAWTAPVVEVKRRSNPSGIIATGAGVVLTASAWLPWLSLSFGPASFTANGMAGGLHGTIVAIVGVVLALVGLGILAGGVPRETWTAVALLAGVGAGVAAYEMSRVDEAAGSINEGIAAAGLGVHAGVGVGLWLTLISGVVGFLAAVTAAVTKA